MTIRKQANFALVLNRALWPMQKLTTRLTVLMLRISCVYSLFTSYQAFGHVNDLVDNVL